MKNNYVLSKFSESGMAMVASRGEAQINASLQMIEPEMITAAAENNFFDPDNAMSKYRPYQVEDGLLTIPVFGALMANFPYQFGAYATGYEYIKQVALRAKQDSNVTKVALLIDSCGGQVNECFPLVDELRALAALKPMKAFAKTAYSAAYALAIAAPQIIVAPVTGGCGSIGIVMTHVDYSESLKKDGMKVTYIKFGAHKTDGNPSEPLSDFAQKRIQSEVDRMGERFVAYVAEGRGMDAAAVRATEALCYVAEEAVSIGLADSVGSLEDALVEFKAETPETISERNDEMNTIETTKAASAEQVAAAQATAIAQAKTEGAASAVAADRARMAAILALPEAKGRESTAHALAMTDNSVEAAKAILASVALAPVQEKLVAVVEPFKAAMEKGNPEVGVDDQDIDTTSAEAVADRIGKAYHARLGITKK